jgi:hypothetical protein
VADFIYVKQVQLRAAANVSFRSVVQYHVHNASFELKHDVEGAWYTSFLVPSQQTSYTVR